MKWRERVERLMGEDEFDTWSYHLARNAIEARERAARITGLNTSPVGDT